MEVLKKSTEIRVAKNISILYDFKNSETTALKQYSRFCDAL